VDAFRAAVNLSPDDADAHYELGICLYKIGDNYGARREYNLLQDKNPDLADKLGRAIGIKKIMQ
jgi:Flp pilus assembly protein TadD